MEWLQLHLDTSREGLDPLCSLLNDQGIDGLVIEDEEDFQSFLENNHKYWDYVDEDLLRSMKGLCRITFYLEDSSDGYTILANTRILLSKVKKEHPEYGSMLLTMETTSNSDWENNWKQFYKPMEIGDRLLVIPEWESVPAGDRVPLILNPGLTFGTGSHATTRLCLQALDRYIKGGEKVTDLGCGSGILSIAALRLGAKAAFACDIDEKAVSVAYENAALNQIGRDRYEVVSGDVLTDRTIYQKASGSDVVLANIVADVIINLSPHVSGMLNPKGLFICSGIIDTRADEVESSLKENHWSILEKDESEGWFSFVCTTK